MPLNGADAIKSTLFRKIPQNSLVDLAYVDVAAALDFPCAFYRLEDE
jgi:hypothetical protein